MSEQILWYAARISGLMTWFTACGALISALLLRSRRSGHPTPADLWVADARRFLGSATVCFLIVHGSAIVLDTGLDVSAAVVFGRGGDGWVESGLLLGVIGGWLVLMMLGFRFFADRLPPYVDGAMIVANAAVVAVGAVHAWRSGSDVRGPMALVVLAVVTLAVLVALVLSLGASTLDRRLQTAPDPAAGRDDPGRSLGDKPGRGTNGRFRPGPFGGPPPRRNIPLPELRLSRTVAQPMAGHSPLPDPSGSPGSAGAGTRDGLAKPQGPDGDGPGSDGPPQRRPGPH